MEAGIPIATLRGGVTMPMIGLGTAGLLGDDGYRALRTAIDLGYRHIDTATAYENETEVGRAIRDSNVDRGEFFVTTKLPPERAGDETAVVRGSLHKLGLDHVDLWLIHWPPGGTAAVPTWRAFIAAQEAGHTRAIGVSNDRIDLLDQLIDATGVTPAVNLVPWNPARTSPPRWRRTTTAVCSSMDTAR